MVWMLAITLAHASCGLDLCPSAPPATTAVVRDTVRFTRADDPDDARGWYVEQIVGAEVQAWRGHATFSAALPLVSVRLSGTIHTGLGSAVVGVEARPWIGVWQVGAGLQAELPTATHFALGDHHAVLLPYVAARFVPTGWAVDARIGFGHALQDSGHADAHGIVNPHAPDELVTRGTVAWTGVDHLAIGALTDARVPSTAGHGAIVEVGGLGQWSWDRYDLGVVAQARSRRPAA